MPIPARGSYGVAVIRAAEIETYWHARGFPQVKAWVSDEIISCHHSRGHSREYGVRSNLVNGIPPGVSTAVLREAA